jgi:hypothetical protein
MSATPSTQPKEEQRYCGRHHTHHPLSDFSLGYSICDKGYAYEKTQKAKKKEAHSSKTPKLQIKLKLPISTSEKKKITLNETHLPTIHEETSDSAWETTRVIRSPVEYTDTDVAFGDDNLDDDNLDYDNENVYPMHNPDEVEQTINELVRELVRLLSQCTEDPLSAYNQLVSSFPDLPKEFRSREREIRNRCLFQVTRKITAMKNMEDLMRRSKPSWLYQMEKQ